MQPTSSGNNTPLQTERTAKPTRIVNDDLASTIRVDAPSDAASPINAPHGPVLPSRSAPGRARGERPKPPATPEENRGKEAVSSTDSPSTTSPKLDSSKPISLNDSLAEAADPDAHALDQELDWKALHAEDISRVLDQRLFEVERRERLLNRRAAQISQQERMFRLWANETRQELERKRRELQQYEAELIQRSNDVRWLLVHGERFDDADQSASLSSDVSSNYNGDFRCSRSETSHFEKRLPTQNTGGALEEELKTQIEELEFARGKDGVRRLHR